MIKVKRALISVSDKTGLVEFAKQLHALGIEILSTGGTFKALKDAGVPAIPVEEYTEFPEMLDGRVKTLHPMVHGGILARRDNKEHMDTINKHDILPIDMVVVNLYPFEKTALNPRSTLEDIIENIDIGGPAMVRSAAKNHASVAIVVSPSQYPLVLEDLRAGGMTEAMLKRLAVDAFAATSGYDASIYNHLHGLYFPDEPLPPSLRYRFERSQELRYGENPYNKAAFYRDPMAKGFTVSDLEQLHGKELSYNNLLDCDAATNIILEFERPCAVIVKHNNPCGVSCSDTLVDAFVKAFEADSQSAFGGIITLNRTCDLDTAKAISKFFVEVVIAPDYAPEALKLLKKKKDIRILKAANLLERPKHPENKIAKVKGGLLCQTLDFPGISEKDMKVVTKTAPTPEQMKAMIFGVKVAKWVKSNTILLVQGETTVGVGAGQMSRVDSVMLAIYKAKDKAKGSVLISDAFFPFRDNIDMAAQAGIAAILQTGGSVRDQEVTDAANEHGIPMVHSGLRLFWH